MSGPPPAPGKFLVIAAFAAVYLIWGSTYLGILLAIQSMPPLLMAGVRFFLAGVIMYVIALWQGAPKSSLAEWRTALIVGACLLFFGNGSVPMRQSTRSKRLAFCLRKAAARRGKSAVRRVETTLEVDSFGYASVRQNFSTT